MPKLMQEAPVAIKERRAWVRYHCELKVRFTEGKPGARWKPRRARADFNYQNLDKRWAAKVYNISRGGMKLEVACFLKVGALFHIELDVGPHSKPLTLKARVTHVGPNQDGVWTIGCSFCHPLRQGDLENLLLFGPGKPNRETILGRLGRFLHSGLALLGLARHGRQPG